MALTEDEVKQVKEQLLDQVENFPDEQRNAAISQIESMNSEQLEEFLVKNNLIKGSNCIFCSIGGEETPSYKILENNNAIAVLDINPLSKGQILVIPKQHKTIEDSQESINLAQEAAKMLKSKMKADEVKTETTNVQGHGLVNVIPIYKGQKMERKKADESELNELRQFLTKQEEQKPEPVKPKEVREVKAEDLPKAPRRIP